MSESVEQVLHAALRGLTIRQQTTANNIANADTPGFHARVVRFEDRLQQALGEAGSGTTFDQMASPTVVDSPGQVARADGNTVDMDQELLTMTDTTMRYNAVARQLSARLALYESVISDGRG